MKQQPWILVLAWGVSAAACTLANDVGTGATDPDGVAADAASSSAVDAGRTGDVVSTDAAVAPDAAALDAAPAPDAAAAVDAALPAPDAGRFGSALALTPARCGAAPYRWLDSPELGRVLEQERMYSFDRALLLLQLYELERNDAVTLHHLPQYGARLYRVRYQTQDLGQLVDATGLIAIPDDDGATSWPVFVMLHGTCGFNDDCSPSRQLGYDEPNFGNAALLSLFASLGYVVVAPDYLGLKSSGERSTRIHPYLVAEPTALASIDAVRAAQRLLTEQLGSSITLGDLVVVGGSQGGHAAAFFTRYAPHYSPELRIAGAVLGIPPTDLRAQATLALSAPMAASANTAAFVMGAAEWYRSAPDGLSEVLAPPHDTTLVPYLLANCDGDTLDDISTLEQLYTPQLLSASQQPDWANFQPWRCYADENTLGASTVPRLDDTPLLMVLAQNDTLVDPAIERASFGRLCEQGYRISYLECADAKHTQGFFYSLDDQLDFVAARLAGEPMPANTCQIQAARTCSSDPR